MTDLTMPSMNNGAQFILADLDTALTFMDLAETTSNTETALRNHRNALTAYNAVLRLLYRIDLDPSQRQMIDEKLVLLKVRLHEVGQDI